jgi:prepilin-type N-terminal cleavage/methylation domain-containing protein
MRASLNMKQTSSRRAGFTLIELMIVITVIALLIGLLLPAITGARRNAQIAQVTTEIKSLEGALAAFKAKYGNYPPSRITLYKNIADWNNDKQSRVLIRSFWPSFDFTTDGSLGGAFSSGWPGNPNFVTLDGPECLLFFLGGVPDPADPTHSTYIGFSTNPAYPFSTTDKNSRIKPFFEFRSDRLGDADGDGNFEYRDPIPSQQMPYLYLSGYDGRGYNTNDLYRDWNPMMSTGTTKWMAGPYTQGPTSNAWNRSSFQLISPGFDGVSIPFDPTIYINGPYGPGGPFDTKTADSSLIGPREVERDNITNFSGGALAK